MKLGLTAAVAMLANLAGGGNAEAARSQEVQAPEITHLKKDNDLHKFSVEEIKRLEGAIESNKLPLYLQVKFMQEALREDGPYAHQLSDMKLSPERQADINKLAADVSARLTYAYTDLKRHPELDEHFKEADKMREATSVLEVQRHGKTEYCNKFNVRDGDEVFSATAFHCIKDTIHEGEYFRPTYTDIALKFIPKEKWELNGVKDISSVPQVDRRADRFSISGKVVTAFSKGLDGKPRVHFSFAMPLPTNLSSVWNSDELRKLTLLGASDWMMGFKPFGEGVLNLETDKTNAAGSSGGPVAVEGFGVVGTATAIKVITDLNSKTSTAAFFFSAPDTYRRGIAEERESRKRRVSADAY